MEDKKEKKKLLGKLADIKNIKIEDIVKIVDVYVRNFGSHIELLNEPNVRAKEWYDYKKIELAVVTYHIHKKHKTPLDRIIWNLTREDRERKFRMKKVESDYGLREGMQGIKAKKYSEQAERVVDAVVKKSPFIIPRTYCSSDFFNPGLFILGYFAQYKDFVTAAQRIIDIVTEKDNVLCADLEEGWFHGKTHPTLEKYLENNEGYGLDSEALIEMLRKKKLSYQEAAEKRLYQAVCPELVQISRTYKDTNVVALLHVSFSLERAILYKCLEAEKIDYMTILPNIFGLSREYIVRLATSDFGENALDMPADVEIWQEAKKVFGDEYSK